MPEEKRACHVNKGRRKKAPHGRRENCTPRVPPPREARSTGEMRGLTVVAGCNNYMDNRLDEVKRLTARQEVRAASAFGPLLAISRVRHHLEGMAFAFSENRTEGAFHDPAHVETLSLGRQRFLAPMIDGKEVSRRTGQEEEDISHAVPASSCDLAWHSLILWISTAQLHGLRCPIRIERQRVVGLAGTTYKSSATIPRGFRVTRNSPSYRKSPVLALVNFTRTVWKTGRSCDSISIVKRPCS